jgi:hypothetical protein
VGLVRARLSAIVKVRELSITRFSPGLSVVGSWHPVRSYHLGVRAGWPLTGRVEELSRISGLTRRRDGSAGVVLAGPAGVGKSRLAREALAAAEQRGALTRWAVATASARVLPLGAFAATLGVVGPDPARLVRRASEALLAGAGRAGVIVGVDDAHLLDELSAGDCCLEGRRRSACSSACAAAAVFVRSSRRDRRSLASGSRGR